MANQEQLEILKQGLEISTRGVYSGVTALNRGQEAQL